MLQTAGAVLLTVKEFDANHFAISSVYHPPLVPLYKQLDPRPTWYPLQKLWAFKNECYPQLMQNLIDADLAGIFCHSQDSCPCHEHVDRKDCSTSGL